MHRNFFELKSGGTIPMLSPRPEKWGGGRLSPVPHRSMPVVTAQSASLWQPQLGADINIDGRSEKSRLLLR